jgi:hypothetical protein
MAKITGKVQVTVPKVIPDRFGIRPGEDGSLDREARLRSYDEATARQEPRNGAGRRARRAGRGWTRAELHDRARPR